MFNILHERNLHTDTDTETYRRSENSTVGRALAHFHFTRATGDGRVLFSDGAVLQRVVLLTSEQCDRVVKREINLELNSCGVSCVRSLQGEYCSELMPPTPPPRRIRLGLGGGCMTMTTSSTPQAVQVQQHTLSFSRIASGLKLAQAQTMAVAGFLPEPLQPRQLQWPVSHTDPNGNSAAQHARCSLLNHRASFHGRGQMIISILSPHTHCPVPTTRATHYRQTTQISDSSSGSIISTTCINVLTYSKMSFFPMTRAVQFLSFNFISRKYT